MILLQKALKEAVQHLQEFTAAQAAQKKQRPKKTTHWPFTAAQAAQKV